MKKACAATLRANPPVGQLPVNQGVLLIARTFVQMQQHRHTADYDGSTRWTRTDAKEKVDSVAVAFRHWKAIRKEPSAQDFLVALLLRERQQSRLLTDACSYAI